MMTGDFGGSSSPVIGSPPQLFPILPAWEPKHSLLWGQQAICMEHRLHEHPLFSPESLATLIEHYPAGQYMLVHVGAQGGEKEWREGDFGGLSGRDVMASIAGGPMWLNLLRVNKVDRRYGELLDSIFDEIQEHIPGYHTFGRINGILISSPVAKVSGLLEPKRRQRRPITFHLDPRKRVTIVEVT